MNDTAQSVASSWNERMRLIRLRRKREKLRFRDELKILPKWLVWTCVVKYVLAVIIATLINLSGLNGDMWPHEFNGHPVISSLALAGAVTLVSSFIATWLLMVGYVNKDAKRRGMHSGLWTLLVIILSPAYFAIGFIIYFLVREPLPYNCPKCEALVGPRFNFCPNCKYDLHPSCPQCKREVAETDKFCPYCAHELGVGAEASVEASKSEAAY